MTDHSRHPAHQPPGPSTLPGDELFRAGVFQPDPGRVSLTSVVLAQAGMETKLMLRHGEQLILNIVIPIAILIGTALIPVFGEDRQISQILPLVLAIAAMGSGFTGQAIAVAFDRRYGALKRTGASGVPAKAIIGGKILAIAFVVVLQAIVLTITAAFVGFVPSLAGGLAALVFLLVGAAAFTAFGLFLGGTLVAEKVLGLSNFIWLVLLGIVGWVLYSQGLGDNGWWTLVPSVALASGVAESFSHHFPALELAILLAWGCLASVLAVTKFRFDS